MSEFLPEAPDGVALIVWIAALAAGYESGNQARVAAVINLFGQARIAAEREPMSERKRPH